MAETQSRVRRAVSISLRVVIAGGLVAALVYSGKLKWSDFAQAVRQPGWVAAGAVLYITATLISMVRWWVLLAAQGVRLRASDTMHLSFVGFAFSACIPGTVSGDVVKAYYLVRETHNKTGAVMSILLDRVLGMFTLIMMAALALSIWFVMGGLDGVDDSHRAQIIVLGVIVMACFVGMLCGASLLFSRRLRASVRFNRWLDWLPASAIIRRLYDAIYLYRDRPGHLALAMLLSFCLQIPIIVAQYCLGRAVLETSLGLGSYFFLGPMGLFINAIPLVPLGVGVGQVGYQFLFETFGSSKGPAIVSMFQVIMLLWNQVGWIFYVKGRDQYRAAFAARSLEAAVEAAEASGEVK